MTILKGVPRIIPPRLLYTIARMGHGDELVIAGEAAARGSARRRCPRPPLRSRRAHTVSEAIPQTRIFLPRRLAGRRRGA